MAAATPGKAEVEALLGETVRVTLSDGRTIHGSLKGTDYQMNLIVNDLSLGLVMVPGAHAVKCEVWKGDSASKATAGAVTAEGQGKADAGVVQASAKAAADAP